MGLTPAPDQNNTPSPPKEEREPVKQTEESLAADLTPKKLEPDTSVLNELKHPNLKEHQEETQEKKTGLFRTAIIAAKDIYQSVKSAFALMWATSPKITIYRAAAAVATSVQPLVYGKLFGDVLTAIKDGASGSNLLTTGLLLFGSYILFDGIRALDQYLTEKLNRRISLGIKRELTAGLFERYEEATNPKLASQLTQVRDNMWQIEGMPHHAVTTLQLASSLAFSVIAVASQAPWPVVIAAAIGAILPTWDNLSRARKMKKDEEAIQEPRRRSWHQSWFLAYLDAVRDLKLLGAGKELQQKYEDNVSKVHEREEKRAKSSLWINLTQSPVAAGAALFTLVYLFKECAAGSIKIGDVSFIFGSAFPLLSGTFSQVAYTAGRLLAAAPFVQGLFEISKGAKKIDASSSPTPSSVNWEKGGPPIEIVKLNYSYDGKREEEGGTLILKNVDLEVVPGEFLALVGDIGAGKSTLFQVMSGLRSPISGEILVDGVPLSSIPESERQKNIAFCFQDPWVYTSLTFRESLCLGNPNCDPVFFDQICKATGFSALLNEKVLVNGRETARFPLGLDTPIGGDFVGGKSPSGGERQLLAITRALLRQPKILFVDEPTANLDPKRSADLVSLLKNLKTTFGYQPTILMVTHDYRRAREADRIIVLSKDRQGIAEAGTHEELMQRGELYYEKFRYS